MASHLIILLLVGLLAGVFGAILGIGGGMIITPVLTIGMGLDIKYAIGASIIAVIATSSGATIAYLKDEMLNLRGSNVFGNCDHGRSDCGGDYDRDF